MTNIISFIIGAGIIQGLFLSFYLLKNKKGNKRANRILAILTAVFSLSIIHSISMTESPSFLIFYPVKIREPFLFLFGPLLFFYVNELTNPEQRFKFRDIYHLIPFIISMCIALPFYFHNNLVNYAHIFDITIWIAIIIHNYIYFYITIKIINRYKKQITDTRSQIDAINLDWIQFFTTVLKILYILLFVLLILLLHTEFLILYFDKIISVILAIVIYSFGYRGFFQPKIFSYETNDDKEKYKKTGLTTEKSKEFLSKLLSIMSEKKPYLNPNLTLPELSEITEIPVNQLSQIINEKRNTNFYNFINEYRVEEVKNGLVNPDNKNYTILSIALDAGFNSKASFNTIFKKYTGLTPSQFQKNIHI